MHSARHRSTACHATKDNNPPTYGCTDDCEHNQRRLRRRRQDMQTDDTYLRTFDARWKCPSCPCLYSHIEFAVRNQSTLLGLPILQLTMLRAAVVSTRRVVLTPLPPPRWSIMQGRTITMSTFLRQQQRQQQPQIVGRRFLSSESPKGGSAKQDSQKTPDDENSIMLTPGEKVVAASRLTVWAGAAVFAAICAYYIGRELIPT